MFELLSKDHPITEKGMMEFQPFGTDTNGQRIQDASGVTVAANVEFLEESVRRRLGPEAVEGTVAEMVRLLNERIHDRAYHVTLDFLKNQWNSYSYEFVMFLGETCADLSGDPHFQFNLGREKLIPAIIQVLGRPFSVSQIFRTFPHFGDKYA